MKKFIKKLKERTEGFTLVELIVVIAILAILAGVAVPAYSGYIKNANDSAVESQLVNVLTAAQASAAMKGEEVVKIVIDTNGDVKAYIAGSSDDEDDLVELAITEFFDGKVSDITKHSEYGETGATWYPTASEEDETPEHTAGWNKTPANEE